MTYMTGQTPACIVFGRERRLPCDILFGSPSEEPKEVIDYVDDLKEKLLSVHETVRHKIRVTSDRMKIRYDLGPYTVVTRINDVVYRIRRRPKTKMKIVHLDRLMKYNNDTVDVSDRDDQN